MLLGRAASVPAALAIVVAVGWSQGWWSAGGGPPPAQPLAAQAALGSQAVQFGDELPARLDVVLDPARVEPGSLRIAVRFAPYTVSRAAVERRRDGRALAISYRWTLACVSTECVPERSKLELQFGPTALSYRTASGRPRVVRVGWPPFTLSSRLREAAKNDPLANLAAVTTPPTASYRLPPDASADALFAVAVLLAAGGAALIVRALRRTRSPSPEAPSSTLSPLERAIALVRLSADGGSVGRRDALAALAYELGRRNGTRLGEAATKLAWSPPEPQPDALLALADEVEDELEAHP